MKVPKVVQQCVGFKQAVGPRCRAESVILKAFCKARLRSLTGEMK